MPPELIPARGTELLGATYEYLDASKGMSDQVQYYLEAIDLWGRTTRHGPVEVELAGGGRIRGNPGRTR